MPVYEENMVNLSSIPIFFSSSLFMHVYYFLSLFLPLAIHKTKFDSFSIQYEANNNCHHKKNYSLAFPITTISFIRDRSHSLTNAQGSYTELRRTEHFLCTILGIWTEIAEFCTYIDIYRDHRFYVLVDCVPVKFKKFWNSISVSAKI